MEIQALRLGQKAIVTGPKQKTIELVSDGKVDYFEDTYSESDDRHYAHRLKSGLRDVWDSRLVDSLSAISREVSETSRLSRKTLKACAEKLGPGWQADMRRESSFQERYRVHFFLGDPQGVATQEIGFETDENRLSMRTFLPGPTLGAGAHSISGHVDSDGRAIDLVEYLSSH
jgi:hypothetical protein